MKEAIQKIERIVEDYVVKISDGDLLKIANSAKLISDKFTVGRAHLPKNYLDDPDMRAAYISHFLITNAAKVLFCLDKLAFKKSDGDKIFILDLGMGPGTASLAASIFFAWHHPNTHVELVGLERCHPVIHDAISMFGMLHNKNHHLITIAGSLDSKDAQAQLSGKKFDIVIAANFFNEFPDEKQIIKVLKHLATWHIKEGGGIIIIDPALQKTARNLMHVRDLIIDIVGLKILGPCLHQKNCPMFAQNQRDWCHFYIEWDRPALIKKMDELVGTDHTFLKLAYFIFGNGAGNCAAIARNDSNLWRVVSSPLISKGKRELVLCGGNGQLLKVMRQDKNASYTNKEIETAKRGDVVQCETVSRIDADSAFKVISR